jgi:hypothetical protein
MLSESITRTLLCCDEPEGFELAASDDEIPEAFAVTAVEEIILNTMHPVWYGRNEGYHGVYLSSRFFLMFVIPH